MGVVEVHLGRFRVNFSLSGSVGRALGVVGFIGSILMRTGRGRVIRVRLCHSVEPCISPDSLRLILTRPGRGRVYSGSLC